MKNLYSNIVPEDTVRLVQKETLDIISNSLIKSFGPKGSSTAIVKNMDRDGVNISIDYTKDGHTIVKNILFLNPIERSVQDMLTELTRNIVKEVGDGTTSAIILCKLLFDELCNNEAINKLNPVQIVDLFNKTVEEIKKRILENGYECSWDDIYDIAMISSNGNEDIAGTIREIYKEYGMEVMIDVGISNEVDNIVKEYDGMTLDTGYTNICFVNEPEKNRCTLKNPRIYCFNDPIDTPEMLGLLDKIIHDNILRAYEVGSIFDPVPTVIFGRGLSPDTSSYFETVVKLMNQYPCQVPLLMVTDIHQSYLYEDIAQMCGAKFIKKYLNPELQDKDIELGLAPSIDTVCDFCGSAEMVQSDQLKTKIVNPAKMFNEDGTKSQEYLNMVKYLEQQVEVAKNENAGIEQIAQTKRRLNCFKGNMIDFLIGGVTLADRNNLKASVEDAVLNCRSAAVNGVGYGANFEAFRAIADYLETLKEDNDDKAMATIIYNAYYNLIHILYESSGMNDEAFKSMIMYFKTTGPFNIATKSFDGKVKSSIRSDVAILETISKVLTLMYTCNQYLVQTPAHNSYIEK